MASYTISPVWGAGAQLFDNNGDPLSGGKIYVYFAGTTTPATTYTDPTGTFANTNPIVANAAGRLANEIWLPISQAYKFILKDANDTLIATYDNIPTSPQPPIVNDASSISFNTGYVVTAGGFTVGSTYEIASVGSTNFIAIGAAANSVGTIFTATGSGAGTGTAYYVRTVQSKLRDVLSVKDFGAVGDGIADDTVAIQAAITYGQDNNVAIYMPEGNYLVSNTIQITAPVTFFGANWGSCFSVSASFSTSSDVLTINPATYTENIILRDFSIQPVSGTPARYGISVDIRNHGVAYCEFSGIKIGQLSNYCFATVPNATPLIDGFFTSVIDRCVFVGGIYLNKAGDSLRITNNTITGPRVGVYVDLVSGGFDGGAHGLLIDGNNITSNGGALYVANSTMGVFSNNNVEMPTPSGVTNNAMIDLAGTNATNLANGFTLINNFLGSAVTGYDTVRVNWGRNVLILGNYVSYPLSAVAYRITANAIGTRIVQNDDAIDAAYGSLVSDLGVGTLFERSFSSELQQSLNLRFVVGGRSIKWQDSAGTSVSCLQLSNLDDFFYVGPDGATALTGGILFRLNGAEVGRWTPAGNLNVTGAGKGVTLKSPDGLTTKTLTINNAGSLVLI